MIKRKLTALGILFCLFSSSVVFAQADRGAGVKATGEKRLALVIGNGAYQHTSPLPNPTNDSNDMAATLKTLGFEVIEGTNQTKLQMENLIRQFGNRLRDTKGVGLVFYAGHGIQADGANYLIPVDADIKEEDEVANFSINLSFLLGKINSAGNGFNIIILDACRNNPFARSWRNYRDIGEKGGLAKVDAPTGTLIAYATKPGATASDGEGKNGLYTSVLLKQMRVKNVDVTKMLQNVRAEVLKLSGNKQVPFDESSLVGDFYFAGRTTTANNDSVNNNTAPNETPIVAKDSAAVEREAWSYIKDSADPQDFRSFLTDFPNGANAGNAKIKLEQAVWDAVKNSGDKGKLQGYLNEFPSGVNAPLAKIRIRQLDVATTTNPNNSTSTTPTNPNLTSGAITVGMSVTNSLGMKLMGVPAGSFQMGDSSNGPIHTVTLSQGFYMGRTEVTQAQWVAVMGSNPSYFKNCDNCPVEQVSWDDVQEFIRKLNAKGEGVYRLPTEAEWEYAARAGTTGDFAGNLDSMAWYSANAGNKTHEVATKQANAWGLYDMHGNVWEWVQDWYGSYPSGSATNPTGATSGSDRVNRGGGWSDDAGLARSAFRYHYTPSIRYYDLGFRVVRN